MLVCDTHADTLYALSAPDRPAGGPLDVTAELLTAGGGVRVQCLALFVCTNGMRMSPTIVERELQAFEGLKQRGFCQITELSQAREGVANAMLTIEGGEAFGGRWTVSRTWACAWPHWYGTMKTAWRIPRSAAAARA